MLFLESVLRGSTQIGLESWEVESLQQCFHYEVASHAQCLLVRLAETAEPGTRAAFRPPLRSPLPVVIELY